MLITLCYKFSFLKLTNELIKKSKTNQYDLCLDSFFRLLSERAEVLLIRNDDNYFVVTYVEPTDTKKNFNNFVESCFNKSFSKILGGELSKPTNSTERISTTEVKCVDYKTTKRNKKGVEAATTSINGKTKIVKAKGEIPKPTVEIKTPKGKKPISCVEKEDAIEIGYQNLIAEITKPKRGRPPGSKNK